MVEGCFGQAGAAGGLPDVGAILDGDASGAAGALAVAWLAGVQCGLAAFAAGWDSVGVFHYWLGWTGSFGCSRLARRFAGGWHICCVLGKKLAASSGWKSSGAM